MDANLEALDQVRSTAIDLGMKFGPKLLVALIIMGVGLVIARWMADVTERALLRFQFEAPIRKLLVNISRVLVLLLFALMALQNLGVELVPLIAGLGIAGAGIALAMQGVLGNVFAGLTIILTRPFHVGEFISIVGEEGCVEDISLFHTTLGHPDLSKVVIPNRKIVGEILHNHGQIRQASIEVRVAYDADLNQALATVNEVLRSTPKALQDPAPVVAVVQLADSSVNIGVRPWIKVPDFTATCGEINKAVAESFRARGIAAAPPRRDVRMIGQAA
jgi:small conductance mechanosensitive channel